MIPTIDKSRRTKLAELWEANDVWPFATKEAHQRLIRGAFRYAVASPVAQALSPVYSLLHLGLPTKTTTFHFDFVVESAWARPCVMDAAFDVRRFVEKLSLLAPKQDAPLQLDFSLVSNPPAPSGTGGVPDADGEDLEWRRWFEEALAKSDTAAIPPRAEQATDRDDLTSELPNRPLLRLSKIQYRGDTMRRRRRPRN